MTPFDCYKLYLALKRHFTPGSGYDYVKYNGKTSGSQMSFEVRKDKVFFMKMSKHPDVMGFLVANLSSDPKSWIGKLPYSKEAEQIYLDREKRLQSLSYTLVQELAKVESVTFNEMFISLKNEHPPILKSFMKGHVSLESLVALDQLCHFTRSWQKRIGSDMIVQDVIEKITKIAPFTIYDKVAVTNTLIKKYSVDNSSLP